ncbi:TIGR02611 family protein [Corynebacterium sp. ACRQJ]|nr:TIGR02611 family protein [Corynebacterium sp. ACRQJ]
MSKMGNAVHERVERIRAHHGRLKDKKHGYLVRPLTLVAGWLVVLVGLIMIPFPAPGWFMVFIGIGVLSLELEWPHRLLMWSIRQYDKFDEWWDKQSKLVKGALGFLLLILIWVTLIALFVLGWNTGVLDWTKSWLQPLLEKLPEGLVSFVRLDL